MWSQERHKGRTINSEYIFATCCRHGKIVLPLLQRPPSYLKSLPEEFNDSVSSKLKKYIKVYNNAFSFTSLGDNIDHSIVNRGGPFTFRIHGQTHHKIGLLLPINGEQPKFAQLYIHDIEHELKNRNMAVTHGAEETNLDDAIIEGLRAILDEVNPYVKYFRTIMDRVGGNLTCDLSLTIISNRGKDARRYNRPSADEVAPLIVGEKSSTHSNRDIILQKSSESLQKLRELHPSYMPLQYPLIFPYSEDGWHVNISYSQSSSSTDLKCQRENTTVIDYSIDKKKVRQFYYLANSSFNLW